MRFVQSTYRAPWKGVVLNVAKRTRGGRFGKISDLLTILVLVDRHGNHMRNRMVVAMDGSWTKDILEFDISWVPAIWFEYETMA